MVDWMAVTGEPGDDFGDIDPPWDPGAFMGDGAGLTRGVGLTCRSTPGNSRLDSAVWKTSTGEVLDVSTQMTPIHARNTLAYLTRNYGRDVAGTVLGAALMAREAG